MEPEEIRDAEGLKAWLRGRPKETRQADALAIATRAALRVLPLWSGAMDQDWARKHDLTALPLLRQLLTSGVARTWPNRESRAAATAAGFFAADIYETAPPATLLAAEAAFSASDAAAASAAARAAIVSSADATNSAARAANAAVAAIFEGTDAMWEQVSADAAMIRDGADPFLVPLWSIPIPDWFSEMDHKTRAIWAADPAPWSFWLRWWDGVLAGRPLDWELQKQVALIPDEVWKQGPAAVAKAIAKYETRFVLDDLIRENPYAWRIVFNPRSQSFEAVAVEVRDLSQVVAAVKEHVKDFHNRCRKLGIGNFGQSVELAFAPVIAVLRRDLRKHGSSPLSLFKGIEAARREMQEIADAEAFAGESYLTRFFLGLQDCAEDICVAAPEIVEQIKAKEAVRYELYSMERHRATMLQVFGLHLDAEGMLKRVALEAVRVIGDDKSSDAEKKEAWYFATAVLPRAARAYLAETIDKDEAPKGPTKASVAKRIVDAADALSKLDKGKDALVENIPQLSDWVGQIIEATGNNPIPFF